MSSRQTTGEILARNPWFQALPEGLARAILDQGQVRRLVNEVVYAAGDRPNGVFALISGEVRVIQTTREGRSALLLIASPGTWFGEAAMIDGQPRTSDAVAMGEAVVLQLNPAVFRRLTSSSGEHYAAFARLVCEQYRRAMEYIVTTANLPVSIRLAQRLVSLADAHGRQGRAGVTIGLRLSQDTLAQMIGVSRQTLNRAVKTLEAQGIISAGYRLVTVTDPVALEALARRQTLPVALA